MSDFSLSDTTQREHNKVTEILEHNGKSQSQEKATQSLDCTNLDFVKTNTRFNSRNKHQYGLGGKKY